jgi:flagella basal body P-ring formation protein FlgA
MDRSSPLPPHDVITRAQAVIARCLRALAALVAFVLGALALAMLLSQPALAEDAAPDERVADEVPAAGARGELSAKSPIAEQVLRLATDGTREMLPGARVEIEVGRLDPRLKLAPCEHVQPYLPPGTRLWGKARVGLRCTRGATLWNVYLPLTVHVYGEGLVAASALRSGSVLTPADLRRTEIDLAAESASALTDPSALVGRVLARPLAEGQALRASHLKPRVWFSAGESVRVTAMGNGFVVRGSGEALTPGVEGRPVRVRTESGRIIGGAAVAENEVEVRL